MTFHTHNRVNKEYMPDRIKYCTNHAFNKKIQAGTRGCAGSINIITTACKAEDAAHPTRIMAGYGAGLPVAVTTGADPIAPIAARVFPLRRHLIVGVRALLEKPVLPV
ncbi:hypothetical protein HNW77_16455 [Komagataeibacter sp. AV436]|uniref:Uncharacterized protein n=1 Tax=Komagataeibacter melomenusus TaxID=2766578 RepID=A0ABX2AHQ7_9PROT|nr:hypothetical protein [Komagataeibacter melomenusus]MBV1832171.1 hypothetical protein [Komagataeibacter melomenusus]NPC67934.1 hypothetical protein [Komagataeibacter melomenusus]